MPVSIGVRSVVLGVLLLAACSEEAADDRRGPATGEAADPLLPAPTASVISPDIGPTTGGARVTITGSNFGPGIRADFGGAAAVVQRVNANELHVTTPAHAAGVVDVQLVNRNGRSTMIDDGYEYVAPAGPAPSSTTDAGTPPAPLDAGTSPPPTDGGSQVPVTCTLMNSGPVTATADNQVIENLRITSTSGAAITVSGKKNVIIRRCEILHSGGPGISFTGAENLRIENVRVVHTGAPAAGPNASPGLINISGNASSGVVVDRARLERGSSGVYLLDSPSPQLRFIEGYDIRGPFPRGQLVQFNRCSSPLLEDFSVVNPVATSYPEDNVSFYQSPNGIARRGVIIGNNSSHGVGVMMEADDLVGIGGLVEDVDTVDMGNGAFAAYPSKDVTFRRVRARDGHCSAQAGRPPPSSNSIIFAVSPDSSNIRLEQALYANHCNTNIVWDASRISLLDLEEQNFTARAAQQLSFCWSPPPFAP